VLWLLNAFASLAAEPESYEGKPIVAIRYSPPGQPLTEVALGRLMPLAAGQALRLEDVRLAIERLFATGRYSDIAVHAEDRQGGVAVTFETKGTWFIGKVAVGNVPEPPNAGQLASSTGLELGEEYYDEALLQAGGNLRQQLRANGFYRAEIEPEVSHQEELQQVNVSFDVLPGERAEIAPPTVSGSLERPVSKIVNATRWKAWYGLLGWRDLTEQRIEEGLDRIRRSYQKQDYLMAKVNLESIEYDSETNRARPSISIEAGPKVRVRATGAKLSKGKLRQLVPVYQERSVDRDLLSEGERNIRDYFQSEGYFDAKVSFSTREASEREQEIIYAVERGERYKLVRVDVQGNRYFDHKTILERMAITPASKLRYRYGRYSAPMLERDLEAIRTLYRSNGFVEVEVAAQTDNSYRGKEREVAVSINIKEGPQYFVSGLELTGVNLRDYETVLSLLEVSEGEPFSELSIAADRDTVLNYYFSLGFPDANFDHVRTSGPKPNEVRIKYVVSEGRRNFVRKVVVSGLERTRPDLVNSRIGLQPGEPLSLVQMVESQRKLYDLGIFARVDTALQNPNGLERDKYVLYQLEEARPWSLTWGFGAELGRIGGSVTNLEAPAGKAGFSPRVSLGLSRANFFGIGHTVGVRTRISNYQQRAVATYLAPQFKGKEDLNLSVNLLADQSRDVRTFAARRLEATLQLGQRLSRANTIQYRYTLRRVGVDQESLKIDPRLIPLYSQPVRLGILSTSFIQDRRDNPIDSRRGIYNAIDVAYASKAFGSQSDFLRILLRNSTYHRLRKDLVFARTIVFGEEEGFFQTELDDIIPLPERLFGGGADSHRGFPENQAGPRDLDTGFPIGGRALLMNGLELRFPVLGEGVGGVLFLDSGNVYSNVKNISFRYHQRNLEDFDYMVHAVGFGLRYRTPIGPVRIDLAYSMNSPRFIGFEGTREELIFGGGQRSLQRISRFQFHFSLGQAF
jgi:outer membrane protein assembly complex protein YaeT